MSTTALPYLIGLLMAILVTVVVYQLTLGARLTRSRRAAQLEVVAGGSAVSAEPNAPREPRSLKDRLRAAGLDLGENAEVGFTLLRVTVAILAGVVVLFLTLPPLVALLAGGIGYALPQLWLSGQTARRTAQIERELPDALGDLVAILRVTPVLRAALEDTRALLARTNPASPLAQEFQWALEDMQFGEETAFKNLAARTDSPALSVFAFALAVFSRSGGDYLSALEAQARGVRQTLEARNSAQAEAADAMLTVKVIPAVLLGVLIVFMQDPAFHRFYFSALGQMLLLGVLGSMTFGYQIVRSMVAAVA